MRRDFGLPAPERRIGLSAHDVAMALGGPEVVLTRATRVDGTPTVPSRWWLRLETVARAIGADAVLQPARVALDWHDGLDVPGEDERDPPAPPMPAPPLSARPRELSVTRIETWLRDPYSIYAARILGLRRLDDLDADPNAAERGEAVHRALDRFVRAHPDTLPGDALERLLAIGRETFDAHMDRPGVWAFWWPRFQRVARWFVAVEAERRQRLAGSVTEQKGAWSFEGPAGPFTLSGVADRIDRLDDGRYLLIDYKTGSQPTRSALAGGSAPQLPLEALILERGGFSGLPPAAVAGLAYWRVGGGRPPGRIDLVDEDLEALIAGAEQGLRELVATFDDPATPYHAVPDTRRQPAFNDYAHLARIGEWAAEPDGGERP